MKSSTLQRSPIGVLRKPWPTRSRWDRALIVSRGNSEQLLPVERLLVIFLLGTILFLGQAGLNVAGGSLQTSILAIYVLGLYQICTETITLSLSRMVGVVLVLVVVLESMLSNPGSSKGSAALALLLYAPFAFESRSDGYQKFLKIARLFSTMMIIVDCMAGLQFMMQFAGHSVVEMFSFRTILPPALQQGGHYHTIAYSGGLFRSNGFFLREPSTLSLYAAIALLCEINVGRRVKVMALHAAAMIVALSGSGFVVLFFGFVLPMLRRAPLRILIAGGILLPLIPIVASIVGLSSLTDRISELSHPGSSGYARFVAPIAFSVSGWSHHLWSLWIGNGPGSILRAIRASNSTNEITDPTWAKLLFEYGLFGSAVFLWAILLWHWGRATPWALRIALIYGWLVAGGNFLNPDAVGLMLILSGLWRREPSFEGKAQIAHA